GLPSTCCLLNTGAPCERLFSSKETNTPRRSCLYPSVIEALQVLKYRYKHERLDLTADLLAREEDYTIDGPLTLDAVREFLANGRIEELQDLAANGFASWTCWYHTIACRFCKGVPTSSGIVPSYISPFGRQLKRRRARRVITRLVQVVTTLAGYFPTQLASTRHSSCMDEFSLAWLTRLDGNTTLTQVMPLV
ncbi:hypothetical protein BD414DRAFT_555614, partial [Trametes punicea]